MCEGACSECIACSRQHALCSATTFIVFWTTNIVLTTACIAIRRRSCLMHAISWKGGRGRGRGGSRVITFSFGLQKLEMGKWVTHTQTPPTHTHTQSNLVVGFFPQFCHLNHTWCMGVKCHETSMLVLTKTPFWTHQDPILD